MSPAGWLPFSTQDVRDQCAQFGDAPLAHPLPVKDLLKMCTAIDELRGQVEHWREARRISQQYAEEFKASLDAVEAICEPAYRERTGGHPMTVGIAEVKAAILFRTVPQ